MDDEHKQLRISRPSMGSLPYHIKRPNMQAAHGSDRDTTNSDSQHKRANRTTTREHRPSSHLAAYRPPESDATKRDNAETLQPPYGITTTETT